MPRRLLTGLLTLTAFFGTAPAAMAASQSAQFDGVRATLSYTYRSYLYEDARLTISNDGQQVYDQPVTGAICGRYCGPLLMRHSVKVLDLNGSTAPDVLVDLYSGGAHCCQVDQVFTYSSSTKTYTGYQHAFGNYGASLRTVDGQQVFLSADNAFAYAFTDYAASGAPVQLVSFTGRGFVDVTRRFPARIEADARHWMSAFTAAAPRFTDTTGVVSAWAADEELLGRNALVRSFLTREAALRHLNSALTGVPTNDSYVTALLKFLRGEHYLS